MAPQTPTPATRERILVYLQENRVITVPALSRAWGLTRADIRYHLNGLMVDGLVEPVLPDPRQPRQRGRPTQQYRLVTGSAPDNLAELCNVLLNTLLGAVPAEQREIVIRALAEQMAGEYPIAANPIQRYNQAVAFLGQRGYRARWEAHASGPRLLLRNCPYAAILGDHPEMCLLDRFLLSTLVRSPLQQTAQMDLRSGKPPACIFQA